MSSLIKVLGYILSIGGVVGLVSYGVYLIIPDISPYLTKPGFLLVAIAIFGILLIILGLILERIKDLNQRE